LTGIVYFCLFIVETRLAADLSFWCFEYWCFCLFWWLDWLSQKICTPW